MPDLSFLERIVDYSPAWWLPGPHLQTLWGRLARPRRLVPLQREVVATADDDDLVLDHLHGDSDLRILILHGLEGSSNSVYVQGMLRSIRAFRHSATVINFRACAREPENVRRSIPNRGRRLYHSGETSDLRHVVQMFLEREPGRRLAAIGVSLGGNVLLKYLGERQELAGLSCAATLSVPYDLAAGAVHLERGIGRVYVASFLRSLMMKAEAVCERHQGLSIDVPRGRRARTFYEFDDAVTAPLHGFTGADQYYEQSSSIRWIERIRIPTLCVSAEDDPFLPPAVLDVVEQLAGSGPVSLVRTRRGGHVGFVSGPPWRPRYWAERLVVEFCHAQAGRLSG